MNFDLPSALIIGIDHFAAKKLAEEIVEKDINVVGVGDYVEGLNEIKNFSYFANLEEVNGSFNYVFDFNGEIEIWNKLVFESEKVTLICINDEEKSERIEQKIKRLNVDWRFVKALGVYGPGMGDDESKRDIGFLINAFKQAVLNKNLILPPLDYVFRLLNVDDLVEAILRASFLSSTEEEVYSVAGLPVNTEVVASVLINEAKMTRYKVIQEEMDILVFNEDLVNDTYKKLRWQPKTEFNEGIKETLQYFFTKIDEENRKKKQLQEKKINSKTDKLTEKLTEKNENKRRYEVVVDEEEFINETAYESPAVATAVVPSVTVTPEVVQEIKQPVVEPEFPIPKLEVKTELKPKPHTEVAPEIKPKTEPVVIEEEMEEIPNFIIKNSNLRFHQKADESVGKPIKNEETKATEIELKIKQPKKKINKNIAWIVLIVLITGIISVPVNWGVTSYQAVNNLKTVKDLIINKKYTEANKNINKNIFKIKKIDEKIDDWGLNRLAISRNYQMTLKATEEALGLESQLVDLAQSAEAINGAIFNDKEISWNKEIATVTKSLNEVGSGIGVLQARLSGDWSWLPIKYRSELQKKVVILEQAKNYVDLSLRTMKFLPEFLGLDGKKREYLVLLQNETELRPGGGFIGSYGLLSFEGGKLLTFEIKDVYESDGQLNGHVEPPAEIKNYLGEANWYLRDANWNANFPDTAVDIQWFLEKETGRKVNGVIGINLGVAKSVLGAVGEIYVPDFKEKINKDNLYEQAEFYAETKFFPGSNQKASFLGGLGKQLFESIRNLKTEQRLKLIQAIVDSLEKNDIQIALNNKEAVKTVADLGWDGAIYQGKCKMDSCVTDYLYLVEANLGINKANYFLYRNIEQTVDISNSSLSRIVKINYENTAKNSNWPGGDYKNYLRIYLPIDVNLSHVSLVDGNNPSSKKIYSNEELKIREINGKKEIGFLVNIPVSQKRIVEIRYSSTIDLKNKNKFSYLNYIQKQSGFGDTGLVTLISFPTEWQPMQVEPSANLVGGKLLFNQKLDRDLRLGVELAK
jgi:hypothetical protein